MNVTYDFSGKVALVTGAASGMGRVSALAFAAAGATVAVTDIDTTGGRSVAEEITDAGGNARFFEVNVTDPDSVQAGVADLVSAFGGLDFAHNNAGAEGQHGKFLEQSRENFDKTVAVNYASIFHCMQAEIPALLERGGGSIVNTASAAGIIGGYGFAPYGGAKTGVIGLTKHVAQEMAEHNIRINSIAPGPINTPFIADFPKPVLDRLLTGTPIGRLGEPDEIAQAVLWLCSDGASYVIGTALTVDGGTVIGGMSTRADDLGH